MSLDIVFIEIRSEYSVLPELFFIADPLHISQSRTRIFAR
jgi:hypothetical protein